MLNLEDLSQFVDFYRYDTLTKVAEQRNISQPTITRTMKRVEEAFGVPIFTRSSNRIIINGTGKVAAEAAIKLLEAAKQCKFEVQSYDMQLHTITVDSCAPAPLWSFIPSLSRKNPQKTITSKLVDDIDLLENNLRTKQCDIAILPYAITESEIQCIKYREEHLSISVPKDHELTKFDSVSTAQINGYDCLLSSDIGFWTNFHRRTLPDSKFLVQTDDYAFKALVRESSLPCFTTDLAVDYFADTLDGRVSITITDEDANVTYYVCYRDNADFKLPL